MTRTNILKTKGSEKLFLWCCQAAYGMDMNNWHTSNMFIWYLRKPISSEILLSQFFSKAFKSEVDCWNCHTSMPLVLCFSKPDFSIQSLDIIKFSNHVTYERESLARSLKSVSKINLSLFKSITTTDLSGILWPDKQQIHLLLNGSYSTRVIEHS